MSATGHAGNSASERCASFVLLYGLADAVEGHGPLRAILQPEKGNQRRRLGVQSDNPENQKGASTCSTPTHAGLA